MSSLVNYSNTEQNIPPYDFGSRDDSLQSRNKTDVELWLVIIGCILLGFLVAAAVWFSWIRNRKRFQYMRPLAILIDVCENDEGVRNEGRGISQS